MVSLRTCTFVFAAAIGSITGILLANLCGQMFLPQPAIHRPDVFQTSTPRPNAYKVVDMQAFFESIGNQPLYTRERLEHASQQLEKARNGEEFELIDCYNETHVRVPEAG
jgi:hypothetical protein